jgi:hypothetical protein
VIIINLHILLVVNIGLVKTFCTFKWLVWQLLSNTHRIHEAWPTPSQRLLPYGWFSCRTNPTCHSTEHIKADIYSHLEEIKQEQVDNFPDYITNKNKFEIPEVELIASSHYCWQGLHGKFTTKALQHSKKI